MARPSPADAARRLLILKAVVGYAITSPPRSMLAQWMQKWPQEERDHFARQALVRREAFWRPVGDAGLSSYLSPKERELAGTTLLTMTDRQQTDASWRVEAVRVLMWALRLLDALPTYDQEPDMGILKLIPTGSEKGFVASARLRCPAEIDRARSLAELWHWRCRTRQLVEEGRGLPLGPEMEQLGLRTLDDVVRFFARQAKADGTLHEIVDDDFCVGGKAYRDLTGEAWAHVRSVTMERHFTLNWLAGYAPGNRWDDTPTDT